MIDRQYKKTLRNKINHHGDVVVLNSMENGQSGEICAIFTEVEASEEIKKMGLKIGMKIVKNNEVYSIGNNGSIEFNSFFGNKILIKMNS